MTHNMTAGEFYESITGYDEIAIERAFDGQLLDWAHNEETGSPGQPTKLLRALIFVDQRREGLKDLEAKHAALNLSVKECQEYFAEEDDDDLDETAGKDD